MAWLLRDEEPNQTNDYSASDEDRHSVNKQTEQDAESGFGVG